MIDKIMPEFHKADWKNKFTYCKNLKMNVCNILEKKFFMKKVRNLYQKKNIILSIRKLHQEYLSTNEEKWNTIPRTYSEIDTLRNKFKRMIKKIKSPWKILTSYIEEMEKFYTKRRS